MFGMKRKAQERAQAQAELLRQVHVKLVTELRDVTANLLNGSDDPAERDRFLSNAEAMRRGIDLVLIDGLEAFDPVLRQADEMTRKGAFEAQSARNFALITGRA